MTEAQKYLHHCRKEFGHDHERTRAAFAAVLAETNEPKLPGIWYLSFASKKFLGAAFVEADTMMEAIGKAHALGINPGGEVLAMPPTDGTAKVPTKYRHRLLSKAVLDQIDAEMKRDEIAQNN